MPACRGIASAAAARGVPPNANLGKPSSDMKVLRKRLLERVVDQRLFREMERRRFLNAVVRENKGCDPVALKEAVRDVEREFFRV